MLNLDRIDISQFIYFYRKFLPLCHKLLKYKPRYDLQSKMFWHSDFHSKSLLLCHKLLKYKPGNDLQSKKLYRQVVFVIKKQSLADVFLKISQISQENNYVGALFYKVAGLKALKRESNNGIFF